MPNSTPPCVALITGAGSGLGRQLTLDLARRGWNVAGLDLHSHGLEDVESELTASGRAFTWSATDVEDPARLRDEVTRVEKQLGPIDLLITCAGIAPDTPAVGMDVDTIARVIGVNLLGVSNTIAAVLPGMLTRRRGHVVAISSLASYWGLPAQMAYCASKAGVNALMESLSLDVRAHGIDVTTICPGHTATPQAIGMYNDNELMCVRQAARHVLHAIDRKKRFYSFPGHVALQLRLLRWLPAWLRDRLLTWRMKRARTLTQVVSTPANKIVPRRINVAPSSIATSKSLLIPIDNSES